MQSPLFQFPWICWLSLGPLSAWALWEWLSVERAWAWEQQRCRERS